MTSASTSQVMYQLSSDELLEIRDFSVSLAKQAGQILLEGIDKRRNVFEQQDGEPIEKLNAVDLVTQTDNGMTDRCPLC